MKKILLIFTIMLCSLSSAQALDLSAEGVNAFKPTNNIIKLNYGPGLYYKSYDFTYGQHNNALLSLDLSVDYTHTFNKGFGFALNFIHSHISAFDGNDLYTGASFYYGSPVDSYWYLDASFGLGYAHNNYTEHKNGVGLFGQAGIHYRIVRHWGVGAELRMLDCFYKKPRGWKQLDENGLGIFSNWRMALTIGVQYFF